MAQLKGIFINAQTKQAFEERRLAGDVKLTLIAFIKDTKEIWTQGTFYKVAGLTQLEVIDLINLHGSGITSEEFKTFLNLMEANDFSTNVQNIFNKANSALQSNDVYNWALSGNLDKIPAAKLDDFLIPGYLYENRFYSTKNVNEYSNEVSASNGKFYYDKDTNKLYVYLNNVFALVSGTEGELPDLSAYLTTAAATEIYATKEQLTLTISDLINGAPDAYNTLKELADALQLNSGEIGDILSALNNYYTKTQVNNTFLTLADAANIYVTKSVFEDCCSRIDGEIESIKARLTALENLWTNVPTDEYHYYIGTEEITTSNYASHLELNLLPSTYTVDEFDKLIYIIFPENENVTVTSGQFTATLVTIGIVDGYKIVRTDSEGGVYGTVTINND